MKLSIKQYLRLISSRLVFVLLGLFLSLAVFVVNAAWQPLTNVNNGDLLTAPLWAEHVNNLNDLNTRVTGMQTTVNSLQITVTNLQSRVTTLEAGQPGRMCGMNQVGGSGLLYRCNGLDPAVSCPPGYTQARFGESGPTNLWHWSCYKN